VFALKIASGAFQPIAHFHGVDDDRHARPRGHQLVKRFGEFEAVKGIDVEIDRGESFGFLGPTALARRARCG